MKPYFKCILFVLIGLMISISISQAKDRKDKNSQKNKGNRVKKEKKLECSITAIIR